MKKIYERAKRIFAWLGVPANPQQTMLAVKLTSDFVTYFDESLKRLDGNFRAALKSTSDTCVGLLRDSNSLDWAAWEGISDTLVNRGYWYRVWTHQEATTPGFVNFFCGTSSFDNDMLSTTLLIAYNFSFGSGSPSQLQAIKNSGAISVLVAQENRRRRRRQRLIDLVDQTRLAGCTDPRDKVFAALGRADGVEELRAVNLDYSRSLVDVYIDVVRYALFHPSLNGLEILGWLSRIPATLQTRTCALISNRTCLRRCRSGDKKS